MCWKDFISSHRCEKTAVLHFCLWSTVCLHRTLICVIEICWPACFGCCSYRFVSLFKNVYTTGFWNQIFINPSNPITYNKWLPHSVRPEDRVPWRASALTQHRLISTYFFQLHCAGETRPSKCGFNSVSLRYFNPITGHQRPKFPMASSNKTQLSPSWK